MPAPEISHSTVSALEQQALSDFVRRLLIVRTYMSQGYRLDDALAYLLENIEKAKIDPKKVGLSDREMGVARDCLMRINNLFGNNRSSRK